MKSKATISKSCPVTVPVNFDADEILKRKFHGFNPRTDKVNNLKDAMHFILDSIIKQSETRKGREQMEDDGLIPLHSDILGKICGKRYKEALTILESESVIYRDDSYSVGNYSMGVCLLDKYASADHEIRQITDEKFKTRVLEFREQQDAHNLAELAKLSHITKWFNEKLTVDESAVHNFIEFYKSKLNKEHKRLNGSVADIESRVNIRYNSSLVSINKILNKDFGLTRTGRDNRLHSTIASMKKELRSFLAYDGKQLVGVDVKSSQPYLFTQLLKPEFYEKSKEGLDIHSLYPDLYDTISTDEVKSILMSVSYGHSFNEVVWENDFYDYLIKLDEAEYNGVKRVFNSRPDVKHTIMMALYDKKHKAAGFERFQNMFPKEASLIKLFHKLSYKTENYLPILMQRLESKLMLEIVTKEVARRLPDAPIIPVHDSILTTPEYQIQVRDIMEDTLLKVTGVKPGLKLEIETSEDRLKELETIAKEDLQKIYKKKTQYTQTVSLRKPLLSEFPELGVKKILSTRYLDNNQD